MFAMLFSIFSIFFIIVHNWAQGTESSIFVLRFDSCRRSLILIAKTRGVQGCGQIAGK